MNYQELKKSNMAQLIFETMQQLDLNKLPEVQEVLDWVNSDPIYFYNEFLYKKAFHYEGTNGREKPIDNFKSNFDYLTKKIPLSFNSVNLERTVLKPSSMNMNSLKVILSVIDTNTQGPGKKEFFTADWMLSQATYSNIYVEQYKEKYPLSVKKAELWMKKYEILAFSLDQVKEVEGFNCFQTPKELYDWVNKEFSELSDYHELLNNFELKDSDNFFKKLATFAKPEVYQNFYLVGIIELCNFAQTENYDDFEKIHAGVTSIFKRLEKMDIKPKIPKAFLTYLKNTYKEKKYTPDFIEELIKSPAVILNIIEPLNTEDMIKLDKLKLATQINSRKKSAPVLKV